MRIAPLDKETVEKLRKERLETVNYYKAIKEIFFNAAYVSVLFLVCYSFDITSSYKYQKAINNFLNPNANIHNVRKLFILFIYLFIYLTI